MLVGKSQRFNLQEISFSEQTIEINTNSVSDQFSIEPSA